MPVPAAVLDTLYPTGPTSASTQVSRAGAERWSALWQRLTDSGSVGAEDPEQFAALLTEALLHRDPVSAGGEDPFDIDASALAPVVGWRCVWCFIERSLADTRPIDPVTGQRRSDDGLCDHCRSNGRPGLPPHPFGHGHTELVEVFCAHLAERYPGSVVSLLGEHARRSPLPDRARIAAWLRTHRPESRPPVATGSPAADPLRGRDLVAAA
ncbi:hypothetical protein [Nocardia sp. CA-290969]|uniref:hypothetical protein n=1 Tax=Nocardia sp. CA-290969 TaxID=3239986 RepID=UPI003D8EDE70